MNELMLAYQSGFSIFFDGMPADVVSLVVVGLALATELFFFSVPFLIIRGGKL